METSESIHDRKVRREEELFAKIDAVLGEFLDWYRTVNPESTASPVVDGTV